MQHADNMEAYSDTEQFSGGETALNMLYELLQSEQTPDQKSSDQISYCPPLQSKNLTLQDSQDAVHLQSPSLCHQQMFPLSPQTKQTSLPPYTKQDSCVAKAPLSPQQKSLNTSLAPQTEQDSRVAMAPPPLQQKSLNASLSPQTEQDSHVAKAPPPIQQKFLNTSLVPQTEQDSHVAMAPPSLQQKSLNTSNQKVNDHDVSTHPTPQLKSLSKQRFFNKLVSKLERERQPHLKEGRSQLK